MQYSEYLLFLAASFSAVHALISTQQTRSSLTHLNLLNKALESFLLGTPTLVEPVEEDPQKELAYFPYLAEGPAVSQARASLALYLRRWAALLEADDSLTTPVMCGSFSPATNNTGFAVESSSGIKISFIKSPHYLSYNEQKDLEKGKFPDRKGAKVDAWSPGGVELVIFAKEDNLVLIARRCDVDGDTIIKKKSEQTIIRRLNEAVRIWKKVRMELRGDGHE